MKGFAKALVLFLALFGNDGTNYRHYGVALTARPDPVKVLDKAELAGTAIETFIALNTKTLVK